MTVIELCEHITGNYKKIRDKLIAHNELRKDGQFHDVKGEGLKYGDELSTVLTLGFCSEGSTI